MSRYILSTIFTRTASTALNFVIALLIARHAGAVVKGDVTLIVTTMSFFIFFSNFLGGQALVYLIGRNKMELLVVPAYFWSLAVTCMGYLFMKYSGVINATHVTSIAALSFLSSIISIHQTILLSQKRFADANLISVAGVFLQLIGVLICFYFLNISNEYAFIYSSLITYLFLFVFSFFVILPLVPFKEFLKHFSVSELSESIRYGVSYQLVEILQFLNLRIYFFQLGLQQGIQYLGVYSIGISVLETVWIIPRSISSVHYVSISNSSAVEVEINRTIRLAKISFIICGLALFFISLVPSSVYVFVFGEAFSKLRHGIRFLFPGILIYSVLMVVSSFYLGIGKYKPLILSNLAGAVTLALIGSFLLPKYVMTGAGLAATISFAVATLTLVIFFTIDKRIAFSKWTIAKEDLIFFNSLLKTYFQKGRD